MIYQELNNSQVVDQLMSVGQFSYDAAALLTEYLNELGEGMEGGYELDPVAERCTWNEYNSKEEALKDYPDFESDFFLHDKENNIYLIQSS